MSPSVHRTTAQPVAAPDVAGVRFIVGQDDSGRWVAVESRGRAGGLFRSRHDAVHFAEVETGRRPEAVVMSSARIALRL